MEFSELFCIFVSIYSTTLSRTRKLLDNFRFCYEAQAGVFEFYKRIGSSSAFHERLEIDRATLLTKFSEMFGKLKIPLDSLAQAPAEDQTLSSDKLIQSLKSKQE